jgi:hypothetical protein
VLSIIYAPASRCKANGDGFADSHVCKLQLQAAIIFKLSMTTIEGMRRFAGLDLPLCVPQVLVGSVGITAEVIESDVLLRRLPTRLKWAAFFATTTPGTSASCSGECPLASANASPFKSSRPMMRPSTAAQRLRRIMRPDHPDTAA